VMTGKERIMASLRGEETDHVSWAPLIDPYYTAWLAAQGYGGADAPKVVLEDREGLWSEETDALDIPYAIRLVGGDILERHSPTVRQVEDSSITRRILTRDMEELEIVETPLGPWRPSAVTAERDIPGTSASTPSRLSRPQGFPVRYGAYPFRGGFPRLSATG